MVKRIKRAHKLMDLVGNKQAVKAGVLDKATYVDGQTVAQVAFDNEYGTKKARPRPFFRNAVSGNKEKWMATLVESMKTTDFDIQKSLGLVGQQMVNDIIESIEKGSFAPNSPVTLLLKDRFPKTPEDITEADVQQAIDDVRKGIGPKGTHNKPLVWTGKLLSSIKYKVDDES